MATKSPRIAFVPSAEVRALLEEISALNGQPIASIASEMLDEVAPVFRDMVQALRQLHQQPEKARELVNDYAVRAIQQVGQATLEFERDQRKRKRKGKGGDTPTP